MDNTGPLPILALAASAGGRAGPARALAHGRWPREAEEGGNGAWP
jgi:hypothetical protein